MNNAQVPVCRDGGAACVVLFALILKQATEGTLMQLETLGFNAPGTADVEQARATLLARLFFLPKVQPAWLFAMAKW